MWPGGCDHASCRNCVRQLCNLHVAEGGLENLRCPDPKCKEPFDRQVQLIVVLWCHIMSVLISGTDCVLSARGSCSAIRRRADLGVQCKSVQRGKGNGGRHTLHKEVHLLSVAHCDVVGVRTADTGMGAVLGGPVGGGAAAALGGPGAGAVAAEDAGLRVLPALLQRLPGGRPELRAVRQVLLCLLQPLQRVLAPRDRGAAPLSALHDTARPCQAMKVSRLKAWQDYAYWRSCEAAREER